MTLFKLHEVPKCTIEFPMEFTPGELSSIFQHINTLLRSSCLIGGLFNAEESINSLFDISEEIAGAEVCGFLVPLETTSDSWELKVSRRFAMLEDDPATLSWLYAPAAIAACFGKGISFEYESGDWAASICDAWGSKSLVAFPFHRERDIAGAFVFGKKDFNPFTEVQVKLLWALSMQAESNLHRFEPAFALSYYSLIDPLTHLYNRQYFDNQLGKEILRTRRSGNNFCLMLFGIDGFTEYKDRFSSDFGDIALQEFSDIMRSTLREVDTLARLGGDEFGVILLESDSEGARSLADRIIDRFNKLSLPGADEARSEKLSISVGIAAYPSDAFDHVDLFSKARAALELARNRGGKQAREFHEASSGILKDQFACDLPVRKIYDAGRSVVDMDKFLEILLFTGMQSIPASRGSIVVKSPEGKGFRLRASIGFNRGANNISGGATFSPGAITNWVVEHQLPLVVTRAEDSPIPKDFRKNGYLSDSFLSIPLTHMGKTLGVLNLTNKSNNQPFTREDLHVLSPIAFEIASILAQGIAFRKNVRSFSISILGSLTDALELRYPFLHGHSSRVRTLSLLTGERLGLDGANLESLDHASLLHDIGIVGIPSNILSKKHSLNEREMDMVRKHPFLGAKLMEGVPEMEITRRTILEHHENFDGSGYPNGLSGQGISLTARILSVAEYYDSVTSERPHRGGLNSAAAIQLIRNDSRRLFDPDVVSAFEAAVFAPRPGPESIM